MESLQTSFVSAVRVEVDFKKAERELRVQCEPSRLAMFGPPGQRRLTIARAGLEETSWHTHLEVGQDLTEVILDDDPRELDVYYLCCKSEKAPFRRDRRQTRGMTVLEYISQLLSDFELTVQPPSQPEYNPSDDPTPKKKRPRGKHPWVNLTRERYFMLQLRDIYIPAFLGLLSDVEDVGDTFYHHVAPTLKSDATLSTYLWVSWRTVETVEPEVEVEA